MLKKETLPGLIRALYEGCSKSKSDSNNNDKRKSNEKMLKVKEALVEKKKYRGRKSPETLKIRQMVQGPMKRRFELQCTIEDSILFGKVAPKRLNEALFDRACASPLEKVFTRHASELVNVPGKKVASICRFV